jgi:hypothetical protein
MSGARPQWYVVPQQPTYPDRRCTQCGKKLSKYNGAKLCFAGGDDAALRVSEILGAPYQRLAARLPSVRRLRGDVHVDYR